MVKLALHDLLELELEGLNGSDVGRAIRLCEPVDVEGALVDVRNVIILEVHDLLGVLNDGRGIGREVELGWHWYSIVSHEGSGLGSAEQRLVCGRHDVACAQEVSNARLLEGSILGCLLCWQWGVLGVLDIDKVHLHWLVGANTDDQWGTLSCCDDLVGVVNRLHQKAKGALQLLDDSLGKVGEVDRWVLVVQVFSKLWDDLCVRLGLKLEALALQQNSQLLVIRDDAIVDNRELPRRVGPSKYVRGYSTDGSCQRLLKQMDSCQ